MRIPTPKEHHQLISDTSLRSNSLTRIEARKKLSRTEGIFIFSLQAALESGTMGQYYHPILVDHAAIHPVFTSRSRRPPQITSPDHTITHNKPVCILSYNHYCSDTCRQECELYKLPIGYKTQTARYKPQVVPI